MFQGLQETFRKTFEKLAGRGKLAEADVAAAAREIRMALLAADVHFGVVKDFVDAVAARAVGREVLESITPAQLFTKIVHDELVRILGAGSAAFDFAGESPLVVLMVGLQGSGKTTTAARFALHCKKLGRRPYLVPADVQRPAAVDQLRALAQQAGVDCWATDASRGAVDVAREALAHARSIGYDTVIVDTAGRLHVDGAMMAEVQEIARTVAPQRILYVADAMTGQDAVRSAKAFDEALPVTGVVLTKLDGDARGGAALSVRHATGKPILFAGVGEKLEDLEAFHPERMASRILGMGDVVSLVEQVAANVEERDAQELSAALAKRRFTFDDFLKQLRMMRKMGPLEKLMGMLPGGMGRAMQEVDPATLERELAHKEAIVLAMTRQERSNPRLLNGSRRRRIAAGAGLDVPAVNRFLKEFEAMEKMLKRFSGGGLMKNLLKGLTPQAFS